MATFTLNLNITLADAEFQLPANAGIYDVKDALTSGGGAIVTTDERLIAELASLTVGLGVPTTPGGKGKAVPHDSFSARFADRTYRRRVLGQMLSVPLLVQT